jgi:hypothetical protein
MRPHHYDSLLVTGARVQPGTALELHARRITRPAERRAVGLTLFKVFLDALGGGGRLSLAAVLDVNSIYAAEGLIGAIVDRLFRPDPVTARGMAELRELIFDWKGPLYRYGDGDLDSRLALAYAAL